MFAGIIAPSWKRGEGRNQSCRAEKCGAEKFGTMKEMDIRKTLQDLEEQLLTHSVRTNPAALSSLLTEEFREFGSPGRIFSKPEIIHELQHESPSQTSIQDFHVSLLSDKIALVTYRAIKRQPGSQSIESLRSSLWIFREGRWQMHFHQGTRTPTVP